MAFACFVCRLIELPTCTPVGLPRQYTTMIHLQYTFPKESSLFYTLVNGYHVSHHFLREFSPPSTLCLLWINKILGQRLKKSILKTDSRHVSPLCKTASRTIIIRICIIVRSIKRDHSRKQYFELVHQVI